jgi:hypothetical protein
VAAGDVNGDGRDDVILGAGDDASPRVKVVDATKLGQLNANGQIASRALLGSFLAFAPPYRGGVTVAAGDVNGDGRDDVITGAAQAIAHVKVFNGANIHLSRPDGQLARAAVLGSFLASSPTDTRGVFVAAGKFNGDARADIVVGATAGGPAHVKVFDGAQLGQVRADGRISNRALLVSQTVFGASFQGGVRVGAVDRNGDGRPDLVVGSGVGDPSRVRVLDGLTLAQLDSFFAFDLQDGAFVAGK